jgi:hypothetical protein
MVSFSTDVLQMTLFALTVSEDISDLITFICFIAKHDCLCGEMSSPTHFHNRRYFR